MLRTISVGAGSLTQFHIPGDFFRLMSTQGLCTVYFYREGQVIATSAGVSGGYAEQFKEAFDRIAIESAGAQNIQFVSRLGNVVSYDAPPMGLVTVANTAGAFTQAAATVGTTSAQLLAANAARRYLLVQNKAASGDIFITLEGTAATSTNGVRIGPGDSLELNGFAPTGAIMAIGSAAGLPAVAVQG